MPPPEDRNRIEDLKQNLYSRNAPEAKVRRKMRFLENDPDIKTDWEHPPEEDLAPESLIGSESSEDNHPRHMKFLKKLLIGSAVFCVLAVGVGAYLFFNGSNLISANNIAINISGPVSIPAGTPVALSITVVNRNSVMLKGADLDVSFPAGTTRADDTTKALDSHRELLGDIEPGATVTKTVQAVIYGEQNLQKTVIANVTYGVAGSSSVFTKQQSYDILINSSPVVLTVSSLKETTSGRAFDLTLNVKSSSENTLKNVLLKATYPFGFSFKSSSLEPSSTDGTIWSIGDMPPGASRTIKVSGILTGENTDLRAFRFVVGVERPGSPLSIGTALMETVQEVTIQKPFVSLALSINSDNTTADYVAQYERSQNITIRWTNNLSESLSNVEIVAHLSGSAYDRTRVAVPGGYFRSATDDVVWNQQTNRELASVAAGDTGTLTFSLTPTDKGTASAPTANPIVTIAGSVSADRTSSSNVQNTTAPVTRNIKVSPGISLSGRVVRNQGPFTNSGPIPPRVDEKTTYTVIWTVGNTPDTVGSAVVTATLPPYVSWTGQVSPSTEDLSFDNNSGTITWNIGTVNNGALGSSGRREASFQVALTPSITHLNQAPIIVNKAVLSAIDSWSGATVTGSQNFLTTSFSTDSSFRSGDDQVKAK